jgi:hypothetical protein
MSTDLATDLASMRTWIAAAAGISIDKVWLQNASTPGLQAPRATGGYITLLPVIEVPTGLPERVDEVVDEVNTSTITQVVEQTWSIQGYGTAAWGWGDLLRRAWRVNIGATTTLMDAGVVPAHSGELSNVVHFLDTGYEPRWVITLTSLARRQTVYEDLDGTASVVVDLTLIRDPNVVAAEATITYPPPEEG